MIYNVSGGTLNLTSLSLMNR